MSVIVRVPPELDSFLRLPNPQSLVIRGPPGSGKTMLSVELMESFPGRRVYVSLRVTRAALLEQIPWLRRVPPASLEIIDAADDPDQVQDHSPEPTGASRLLADRVESKELADFLWLPRAVQAAWSLTDDVTPTMMVFDSWDAIIDQYFERVVKPTLVMPSRPEVERILLSRMTKGNISLVLVLERDTPSVLDYHVNGIVETYRHVEEGRLERWLSLPKLRGVAIHTDTYPFTLSRGRFAAITPTTGADRFQLQPPAPDPQPGIAGIWPGSTDFADGLGRLRYGALTLLELDSAVPREITRVILGPMVIQTLRLGGRVLILPPPSLDPEDSFRSLRDHVSPQVLQEQLRVVSAVPLNPQRRETPELFVPFHNLGWTDTGSRASEAARAPDGETAKHSDRPNLIIAYLSGLEALTEAAGVRLARGALVDLAAAVFPDASVHVAAVGRTGDPLFPSVSPIAELHVKIRCPHGRIFLNGHRPYLAPMVLSQEPGPEPYRLNQVL